MKAFGFSPLISRLLAVVALGGAFLVMASVFVPHQIEAQQPGDSHRRSAASDQTKRPSALGSRSTDPHVGLPLLGSFEYACCIVRIYATDYGPRYSVYEIDGDELIERGMLLSEQQMQRHHPDLPISGVEFGVQRQLMLAPVRGGRGGWEE